MDTRTKPARKPTRRARNVCRTPPGILPTCRNRWIGLFATLESVKQIGELFWVSRTYYYGKSTLKLAEWLNGLRVVRGVARLPVGVRRREHFGIYGFYTVLMGSCLA